MSHQPERTEKNCLNCGTIVAGRYCQNCGQENMLTKQSAGAMVKHFIYDIFHFDGKFFDTLKHLLFRPGFVPKEYVAGKRISYLDPIRMYLFVSAIFFLVFFSINSFEINNNRFKGELDRQARLALSNIYKQRLEKNPADSFLAQRILLLLDTTKPLNIDSLGWQKNNDQVVTFGNKSYSSLTEYDSVQSALPQNEKDGWLEKKITRQGIRANEKYGNGAEGATAFFKAFVRKMPYLLFLSLPFFALILKLLYARRKFFYYSDHAVFTLYHYILTFILLLFYFLVTALYDWLNWGLLRFFAVVLILSGGVYLLLAMKRFYGQRWWKTFAKYLLLNFMGIIVLLILFIAFLFFSIFQI